MACTGVGTDDFDQIWTDMGQTVSYQVVTKTEDPMTGEPTTTFGTASNQIVIFFLEDQRFVWDKEGLVEVGDAYIIAKTSLGVSRYDQFTVGGQTYYVDNVVRREVLGTDMMDYCTCFKVA